MDEIGIDAIMGKDRISEVVNRGLSWIFTSTSNRKYDFIRAGIALQQPEDISSSTKES